MYAKSEAPWEPRDGRLQRKEAFRPLRKVLILCEDTKSSKLYLDAFPIDHRRIDIQTVGTGRNTDSLVEYGIQLLHKARRQKQPYNEVFAVFDRDSFPAQNFNRAFQIARNTGVRPIWINEAFELWYLLHFDLINTAISRLRYSDMLEVKLGIKYEKNDPTMYDRLLPRQSMAIKNAARLRKQWIEIRAGGCDPESCNPSTNFQDLIEFMNQLVELGEVPIESPPSD